MTRLRIETENSTYHIDTEQKTWRRESDASKLRTEGGTFLKMTVAHGECMKMVCEPINPKAVGRLIITSPVCLIEEES